MLGFPLGRAARESSPGSARETEPESPSARRGVRPGLWEEEKAQKGSVQRGSRSTGVLKSRLQRRAEGAAGRGGRRGAQGRSARSLRRLHRGAG